MTRGDRAQPAQAPMRALVVDDHPRIRDPLAVFLRRHGWQVRTAADLAAMRLLLRHETFDVVVLDAMLPDGDGIAFCGQVRERYHTPVVLLTARDGVEDRIRGLEGGADDYIVKPFDPRELLARLRTVLRRNAYGPVTALREVGKKIPPQRREVSPAAAQTVKLLHNRIECLAAEVVQYRIDECHFHVRRGQLELSSGAVIALSDVQARLLSVLVSHANQILNRDELLELTGRQEAEEQWAYDRTIDRQISRLRVKLASAGVTALRTVRGQGYMLVLHEQDR